jgi:hypothetical protein
VSILNRLKRYFLLLAGVPGLAVIFWWCPPKWTFVALFIYGQLICGIDLWLNPRSRNPRKGPPIPWNRMDAGDRLEYFFPAICIAVPGALLFIIAALWSGSILDKWMPLAFGVSLMAMGAWLAFGNWRNRWGGAASE